MKVVIVDYGMGNIKSINGALKHLGVQDVSLSNCANEIASADKLILPGVGSFAEAMANIQRLGLDILIEAEVVQKKKPILGICLGMQLLSEESNEDGVTRGLGFIPAKVSRLSSKEVKVPHVGFNQVITPPLSRLYQGLRDLSDFYFTHSYCMTNEVDINQGLCEYGSTFTASYEVDNVAGVQFHPELSQVNGLKLIENFLKDF